MKIIRLAAIILLFTVTQLNAQVVTPSLDSGFPVELASAAAWRFGSAFGARVSTADEKSESSSTDYYNADTSVLFAYQPGTVVTEFYWAPSKKENIWDPSSDTFTMATLTEGRFKLAIRGENKVSVGIGYNFDGGEVGSTTIKSSSYEGSFSIRMLDIFYLAGGMQRVTETYPNDETIKWNQVLAGIALQAGDPFSTIFKMEASTLLSPEETNENGNETIEGHPKSTELTFSTELAVSNFLFSYRYENNTCTPISDIEEDRIETSHRLGFGIRMGSFLLGIYGTKGQELIGDEKLDLYKYQATLSFGFI